MADREKVVRELKAARLFFEMGSRTAGVVGNLGCKSGMKYIDDAIALLEEQEAEARLLTAEEVQNMEAGTAFGIETYYDHDGERMPGCAWALRTERLILSYFGTMLPDTVTKIPYNTLEENQNTGKHEKHQYRFWSKKPTFEQCKAVKWDD